MHTKAHRTGLPSLRAAEDTGEDRAWRAQGPHGGRLPARGSSPGSSSADQLQGLPAAPTPPPSALLRPKDPDPRLQRASRGAAAPRGHGLGGHPAQPPLRQGAITIPSPVPDPILRCTRLAPCCVGSVPKVRSWDHLYQNHRDRPWKCRFPGQGAEPGPERRRRGRGSARGPSLRSAARGPGASPTGWGEKGLGRQEASPQPPRRAAATGPTRAEPRAQAAVSAARPGLSRGAPPPPGAAATRSPGPPRGRDRVGSLPD